MCQMRRLFDDGEQRQDQHQRRNAHHDFDQPAEKHIDPAAEVSGHRAERDADRGRDARRDKADEQRDPRAVDDLGEDVDALSVVVPTGCNAFGPAFVADGILGLTVAIRLCADAAVRILKHQRPDGPALGVLLLQSSVVVALAKPILVERSGSPSADEVAQARESRSCLCTCRRSASCRRSRAASSATNARSTT